MRAGHERLVFRLRKFWERRGELGRATGIGLFVSVIVALGVPRRYEAFTRLMPPDQASSGTGLAMLASESGATGDSALGSLATGLLGLKSSGALFVGILQSETVQDDIVREFQLQKVYGDRYPVDARSDLARYSGISEDRKSGIITISVTDSDPERAAAMARRYTEELNTVVNQMSTSSARREREFLEARLRSVQADLGAAEKQWSDFASTHGTVDIQAEGKAMIEGAAMLQGRLIAAESELQGLKQAYTNDNVRVRSVRAEIAELKAQLEKWGGTASGPADEGGAGAEDMAYPSIRKLPALGVASADLYRRTKTQEAVFEALTREYELAKVEEVKETPSVKVLDPARVPQKKSFPPRTLIVLGGTCAGLAAGVLWLAARALWDDFDPDDPRRELALEIYDGAKVSWHTAGVAFSARFARLLANRSRAERRPPAEQDLL